MNKLSLHALAMAAVAALVPTVDFEPPMPPHYAPPLPRSHKPSGAAAAKRASRKRRNIAKRRA